MLVVVYLGWPPDLPRLRPSGLQAGLLCHCPLCLPSSLDTLVPCSGHMPQFVP